MVGPGEMRIESSQIPGGGLPRYNDPALFIAADPNWFAASAETTRNELRQDRGAYRLTVVKARGGMAFFSEDGWDMEERWGMEGG